MQNIGLFFGSFNPVHMGHLIIGSQIYNQTNLDEIWFVVSPLNPHKRNSRSLIHEFDRLKMVELAIAGAGYFRASDMEFHLPKPNYTIDTLVYLSERHPSIRFSLIIGEDNLSTFTRWKNYERILENFRLVVYPRPNTTKSELLDHEHVTVAKAPLIDISASLIRDLIKKGKSIKYLVPEAVEKYMDKKNLYR